MTFEYWWEEIKGFHEDDVSLFAKAAWDYQQARIEALVDFNYRRRKAYRDRVIDALHNIDTEGSPELEDALNLAHNAIYNAVTKALLGE